ncbi:MAG TPA: glutamate-cysteine ligase family protein [Anaeromyxobacteraceae bacterium]|nr:glutamate-cysteine ligase family protein [Anaeromyxobacteraceae bacterium]
MSLDPVTRESPAVRGMGDLVAWFRARERAPSEWKVGLEHEKVPLRAGTLEPVPYDGPGGIAAALRAFGRFGYAPFEEDGRVIAAQKKGLTVSIEPGGQIELSGRPFADVHVVAAELDRHLEKCRAIAEEIGIEMLAVGYRPWGTPASAAWMPKARYLVMRPFLAARGRRAEDMMSMTASTQVSFDFGSEPDLASKLRTSLAVQPAVAALYANAPVVEGRPCGWKSFRAAVWEDVDPARQGLLAFAFEDGFEAEPYRRYASWALDVPMVFLRRGGRYLETGGATFRRFLSDGLHGERPTLADWEDHLSTLFPDVRVKGVVEVRAADACDAAMTKALAALWKGILYEADARAEAWRLVAGLSLGQRHDLGVAAGREGLAARLPDGRALREVAVELVEIAARGLCRQRCCGEKGQDERVWLEPLRERAASGRSPADEALEAFERGGPRAMAARLRVA